MKKIIGLAWDYQRRMWRRSFLAGVGIVYTCLSFQMGRYVATETRPVVVWVGMVGMSALVYTAMLTLWAAVFYPTATRKVHAARDRAAARNTEGV